MHGVEDTLDQACADRWKFYPLKSLNSRSLNRDQDRLELNRGSVGIKKWDFLASWTLDPNVTPTAAYIKTWEL